MPTQQFKSYTGKKTDILHSRDFLSKSFKDREKMAFDKETYKNLSKHDSALLQGFASATAQQKRASAYKKKQMPTTTGKR